MSGVAIPTPSKRSYDNLIPVLYIPTWIQVFFQADLHILNVHIDLSEYKGLLQIVRFNDITSDHIYYYAEIKKRLLPFLSVSKDFLISVLI